MLIRYWFEFSFEENHNKKKFKITDILKKGAGVTAFDRKDAIRLLEKEFFNAGIIEDKLPEVKNVMENFDISTIQDRGIIANMGVCVIRGVWYPKLS
jgi:hypothetical protein